MSASSTALPLERRALIELGAHEATSVAEACDAMEAVITMLADDDAASEIALGEGGLVAHLPKGAIHLSMSSISVALSEAPGSGTCASRTALRCCPRLRAAGHGGGRQAVHRRRRRSCNGRGVSSRCSVRWVRRQLS